MTKTTKNNFITCGITLGLFVIFGVLSMTGVLGSQYSGLLIPIGIYIILSISLNLTVGILGELSLGHAGFMCIGAYVGGIFSLMTEESINPSWLRMILALIVGGIAAAIFGILIGIPVLRLRGDYLAIVTLAFGEIIKNVINVLYVGKDENGLHFAINDSKSLNMSGTGEMIIDGAKGITGTPRQSTFLIGVILILVALFVVFNLVNSRSGRAIMAIRDNRIAAESVGINITKFKLMAFTISAAIAGAGGVLYAHNLSSLIAQPANFGYNMSIMILVFVVLGGIGSFRGSIIAAVVLTMLPEVLRGLRDYRMLIYAVVLIAMMLFNWAPAAITWRQTHSLKNLFAKKTKEVQ